MSTLKIQRVSNQIKGKPLKAWLVSAVFFAFYKEACTLSEALKDAVVPEASIGQKLKAAGFLFKNGKAYKPTKVRIQLPELYKLLQREHDINATPFDELEWVDAKGKTINVTKQQAEEFKFCGLNNLNFVECGFINQCK